MKFTVAKGPFLQELALLVGIADEPRNQNIPILSNVLIESLDIGTLSLAATDLETSLRTTCEAVVEEPGAFSLPAKKLHDIVAALPGTEIVFAQAPNSDMVRITCGRARFELLGLGKEHFPEMPTSSGFTVALWSSALHTLINRTVYVVTHESSAYILNSALLTINDGEIRMVACDGHRLAIASAPFKGEVADVRVLVPQKTLALLEILTDNRASEIAQQDSQVRAAAESGDVQFGLGANHVFFKLGARELSAVTPAGRFPNYEVAIPKDNETVVSLNATDLAPAIDRALLVANERSHCITIELKPGALVVGANSYDDDSGNFEESIPIDYTCEPLKTAFNGPYLAEFLETVAGKRISLAIKGEEANLNPALISLLDDSDYRYVVMQMRVL